MQANLLQNSGLPKPIPHLLELTCTSLLFNRFRNKKKIGFLREEATHGFHRLSFFLLQKKPDEDPVLSSMPKKLRVA